MTEPAANDVIEISQVLIDLMPVIVGGVLGVVGSIVGGIAVFKVQASDRKEQRKTEKLEKLALLAYECLEWIDKFESAKLFDGSHVTEPWPLNELRALARIYHPELKEEVTRIEVTLREYRKMVMNKQQVKIQTGKLPEEDIDAIIEVYEPLLTAVDSFIDKVEMQRKP